MGAIRRLRRGRAPADAGPPGLVSHERLRAAAELVEQAAAAVRALGPGELSISDLAGYRHVARLAMGMTALAGQSVRVGKALQRKPGG